MRQVFVWGMIALTVSMTSSALACYEVTNTYKASKKITCDDGSKHTISERGEHWYWDGERFDSFELAAKTACGCEDSEGESR